MTIQTATILTSTCSSTTTRQTTIAIAHTSSCDVNTSAVCANGGTWFITYNSLSTITSSHGLSSLLLDMSCFVLISFALLTQQSWCLARTCNCVEATETTLQFFLYNNSHLPLLASTVAYRWCLFGVWLPRLAGLNRVPHFIIANIIEAGRRKTQLFPFWWTLEMSMTDPSNN